MPGVEAHVGFDHPQVDTCLLHLVGDVGEITQRATEAVEARNQCVTIGQHLERQLQLLAFRSLRSAQTLEHSRAEHRSSKQLVHAHGARLQPILPRPAEEGIERRAIRSNPIWPKVMTHQCTGVGELFPLPKAEL